MITLYPETPIRHACSFPFLVKILKPYNMMSLRVKHGQKNFSARLIKMAASRYLNLKMEDASLNQMLLFIIWHKAHRISLKTLGIKPRSWNGCVSSNIHMSHLLRSQSLSYQCYPRILKDDLKYRHCMKKGIWLLK